VRKEREETINGVVLLARKHRRKDEGREEVEAIGKVFKHVRNEKKRGGIR